MAAGTEPVNDDLAEDLTTEPSEIQKFYEGAVVFVTGGTGFMGQILLEKLLRSCPNIQRVYLLIRPKRGKQVVERMQELFQGPVFTMLDAAALSKVTPIPGDAALEGLGLSPEHHRLLASDVTVLFHAAATVRFDENLRTAIMINVRGTQAAMTLAREMECLKAFVYISTAYANCPVKRIREEFLPPSADGDTLMTLCKLLTDSQLQALQPELLGQWPNTYAFTKSSAEDVVRRLGKDLPVAIVRPSIVVNTLSEPIKGWINNLYGPSGVCTGAAVGLLKSLHCNSEIWADIVPVDKAINCCIAAAWSVAADSRSNQQQLPTPAEHAHIYNYVSSVERPLTWGEYMGYSESGIKWPPDHAIWYYCFTLNKHRSVHLVYVWLLHLLPALIVDTMARIMGKKPKLLEAYRKVHKFSDVIAYFCTQQWHFRNDNTRALWLRLNAHDKKLFHFNMADVSWPEAMLHSIRGMRTYVLKESFDNLDRAQRKYRRLKYAHYTLVSIFSVALLFFAYWLATIML